MKNLALVGVALLAIIFASCSHEIKVEKVHFTVDNKGRFTSGENPYVIIEEPGFKQQELYAMVKNNVMKFYNQPDAALTENSPVSLVVNGYEDKVFDFDQYGVMSMSYRILFEFSDGEIKVTPAVNDLYDEDYPEGHDFATFMYWNATDYNHKFMRSFLPAKQSLEDKLSATINTLLWWDGQTQK